MASRLGEYVRGLYKSYEPYLKPLEDVMMILANGIAKGKTLSREIVELGRKERH
jgi:hypothetical protein